jgi:hypothetical protein
MNVNFCKKIERIIETPFVENELEDGSVCFEKDEDLRADYRLQFTYYNVVNYVYGIINELHYKKNKEFNTLSLLKIPYPLNAAFFWKYNAIGKEIRLQKPIKEIELIDVTQLNWEIVKSKL